MPRLQPDPAREQFWRRHVADQSASGLSIRGYCSRHGLNETSFYHWRRTIRDRDRRPHDRPRPAAPPSASAAPAKPVFLPVAVVDDRAARRDASIVGVEIRLAGGHRIRVRAGCDRALLADVLALLQDQTAREGKPC